MLEAAYRIKGFLLLSILPSICRHDVAFVRVTI